MIGLALWLILWGLLLITNLRFEAQNLLLGVLAIVTGILVALDK